MAFRVGDSRTLAVKGGDIFIHQHRDYRLNIADTGGPLNRRTSKSVIVPSLSLTPPVCPNSINASEYNTDNDFSSRRYNDDYYRDIYECEDAMLSASVLKVIRSLFGTRVRANVS